MMKTYTLTEKELFDLMEYEGVAAGMLALNKVKYSNDPEKIVSEYYPSLCRRFIELDKELPYHVLNLHDFAVEYRENRK